MRNYSLLAVAACLLAQITSARAADADPKDVLFTNAYLSLCMRNVADLEKLRAELLTKFPAFPPPQAKLFLNGQEGDAWPSGVQENDVCSHNFFQRERADAGTRNGIHDQRLTFGDISSRNPLSSATRPLPR